MKSPRRNGGGDISDRVKNFNPKPGYPLWEIARQSVQPIYSFGNVGAAFAKIQVPETIRHLRIINASGPFTESFEFGEIGPDPTNPTEAFGVPGTVFVQASSGNSGPIQVQSYSPNRDPAELNGISVPAGETFWIALNDFTAFDFRDPDDTEDKSLIAIYQFTLDLVLSWNGNSIAGKIRAGEPLQFDDLFLTTPYVYLRCDNVRNYQGPIAYKLWAW